MRTAQFPDNFQEAPGNPIRFYRQRRNWTQRELAEHSGFSERLIRKVERGGTVRKDTLALLAEALSTPLHKLTAEDLRVHPMAVAQEFVRGYLKFKTEATTRCKHLFHPDVVCIVHANKDQLAFGGEYHGIEEFDKMIRTAYELFDVTDEDFGRWFVSGNTIAALRQQTLRVRGHPNSPAMRSWLLHEYTVVRGKIKRVETYTDTGIFTRLLDLVKKK